MAVWFLQEGGIIVLTLLFRISYGEYDLLENLKPKRNDPPELTDFLKCVLHKKDEFKEIRELAKQLQIPASPIDEDMLGDQEETYTKTRFPVYKHFNRKLKHPHYRLNNVQHHPLSRRSSTKDRPLNDVYPYLYNGNIHQRDTDERQERSPWHDIKEKKHKYGSHHTINRFRRGLDLTDYSSDNDLQRGNIKIFPRSKAGFRIVPGNRYQQRRDIAIRDSDRSIADGIGSTERTIPDDSYANHDILGFKAESLSESTLTHDETPPEETSKDINETFDLNNFDLTESEKRGSISDVDRRKRSMKLNIIDDNNLITRITQNNSANTVVLSLRSDMLKKHNQNLQRKSSSTPEPIDFKATHNALHLGNPHINIHKNPSHAVEISKGQEIQPDIYIEFIKQHKENKEDSGNGENKGNKDNKENKEPDKDTQDTSKQQDTIKKTDGEPLMFQLEENNGEKEKENQDDKDPKKNNLEDFDEPTSALEQFELSTKPYIKGLPRSEDIILSLKGITEFLDPVDSTTNRINQFLLKESKDMVHGNNKKCVILEDKRTSRRKIPLLRKHIKNNIFKVQERGSKRSKVVYDCQDHYQGRKLKSFDDNQDQPNEEQRENQERDHNYVEENINVEDGTVGTDNQIDHNKIEDEMDESNEEENLLENDLQRAIVQEDHNNKKDVERRNNLEERKNGQKDYKNKIYYDDTTGESRLIEANVQKEYNESEDEQRENKHADDYAEEDRERGHIQKNDLIGENNLEDNHTRTDTHVAYVNKNKIDDNKSKNNQKEYNLIENQQKAFQQKDEETENLEENNLRNNSQKEHRNQMEVDKITDNQREVFLRKDNDRAFLQNENNDRRENQHTDDHLREYQQRELLHKDHNHNNNVEEESNLEENHIRKDIKGGYVHNNKLENDKGENNRAEDRESAVLQKDNNNSDEERETNLEDHLTEDHTNKIGNGNTNYDQGDEVNHEKSYAQKDDNKRKDKQREDKHVEDHRQREFIQRDYNNERDEEPGNMQNQGHLRKYNQRRDENNVETRYGYLDYENGRKSHIRDPGFTANKVRVKRDLTNLFGMNNDEDYSEDLLNDYNPSIKQERSDYSYEEEGDSAVPEKQAYEKKKHTKETHPTKTECATSSASSITSELQTRCGGSGNHTTKVNIKEQLNINRDDNLNAYPRKIVNKVRRDVHCTNCKENMPNKNYKCDNCKLDNEEEKECKNCHQNAKTWPGTIWYASDPIKVVTDSQIISEDEDSNKEDSWGSVENSNTINVQSRNSNQTNSSIPGRCGATGGSNTTIHHKTTTNNTSSEQNKIPPKEEANADQIQYKFKNPKNETSPCGSVNSSNTFAEPNLKEDLEDTNFEEPVRYAHHPLKSKNTHTINQSENIDDILTHFHTKHNQNEFNHQSNEKSAREELPNVETIAERSFQDLNQDNHNEMVPNEENEGVLYLLSDSLKNNQMNENKRNLKSNEGDAENDKTKRNEIINKSNVQKLTETPNQLLNSVENFANIVEEVDNNINKRYAKVHKRNSNNFRETHESNLHSTQINRYKNDAPFEKFYKLNKGYWKKVKRRIPRRHEYNSISQPNYVNEHLRLGNLRRIRRDHSAQVPEMKTKEENDNIPRQDKLNRVIRNKSQCTNKPPHNHKGDNNKAVKEWLDPKKKQKCPFLGKDSGLNPSFGLKPSKGSCDDEAELERGSKDYSQLQDALNGRLACLIVQTTFKKIKEHPHIQNRFSHGLTRQHGFKNEMKNLNAFRNNETEKDVRHTEEMLHQIMTVLNKIILDQVRRRTCKHLSPELQKYLAGITRLKKHNIEEDKISEDGFPLPLVKDGKQNDKIVDTEQGNFLFNNPDNKPELEMDEEEVKKKMRMVKELLNKYKHMSGACKVKVETVEEYLKKHLCMLKKILKEIKERKAQENKQCNNPTKQKRKDYQALPHILKNPPDFSQYNQYTKTDLINKQLSSLGLGPSPNYKLPPFNLNKLIEDAKSKLKYNINQKAAAVTMNTSNKKSNYRLEQEDYENVKDEYKREVGHEENNRQLSEKYKKLAKAAETLRNKRETEQRLGKLFGKTEKRSIKNENYNTIKSLNKHYHDYSHIGFETPKVFSLKK